MATTASCGTSYLKNIEIVRSPAQGWRPVDPDTRDRGGTTEGVFSFWWRGEVLYGPNEAVGDSYLLGWSREPAEAPESRPNPDQSRVLIWQAIYHPDGGQPFFIQGEGPRRRASGPAGRRRDTGEVRRLLVRRP